MDDRFADPPAPTLEQGIVFQNTTTTTTAGTTGTTGRPGGSVPIPSGPGWPVDENDQDAKYLTLVSKLENLEAGHRLILDDIATLSNRISKITEAISTSYEARPSAIESPKSSFSKSLHVPKAPSVRVEKLEAGLSLAKIPIPLTAARVARFEIQSGSPYQVVKERELNSSDIPSTNVGLTRPGETPTRSTPGRLSVANSCTKSPEGSKKQNFNILSQPEDHIEDCVPQRSGGNVSFSLSSEEPELFRQRQDEEGGVSRLVVQRLANNDALFNHFVRYLKNRNASFTRQIATEPDKTAHLLAHSFRNAVQSPRKTAPIALPEFSEIRATICKMSSNTCVDLYIELSQRYRKKYGVGS